MAGLNMHVPTELNEEAVSNIETQVLGDFLVLCICIQAGLVLLSLVWPSLLKVKASLSLACNMFKLSSLR